jgi:hypothetical protein
LLAEKAARPSLLAVSLAPASSCTRYASVIVDPADVIAFMVVGLLFVALLVLDW